MIGDLPTEAAVVRATALESVKPEKLDIGAIYGITVPEGAEHQVLDLEWTLETPRRKRGTITLHTQDAFAHFVNEHKDGLSAHLYADADRFRFTAVFNDDEEESPGWRDHRAVVDLKQTKEWAHWASKDGQMLSQSAFAEHIEDGLLEIVEPDAAYVLELAQHFQASGSIDVRSAHRLDNGQVQVAYVESIDAKAGRSGELMIPKEIVLGIAPFDGTQPYKVVARLRYRLEQAHLKLGYRLDRPHEVLRSAFNDARTWISEDTSLYALLGEAPPTY